MKRYQECAIVKCGNKRVGYYIIDGGVFTSEDGLGDWVYIDAETFEEMVRAKEVKYLVWNNGIKCVFTNEEKRALDLINAPDDFVKRVERNYFNIDLVFNYNHVLASGGTLPLVAGCANDFVEYKGRNCVVMYFVGTNVVTFINNLTSIYPDFRFLVELNTFVAKVLFPVDCIDRVFNSLSFKPLVSTSTIKFMVKDKGEESRIVLRRDKKVTCSDVISSIDSLTAKFSRMYSIH